MVFEICLPVGLEEILGGAESTTTVVVYIVERAGGTAFGAP